MCSSAKWTKSMISPISKHCHFILFESFAAHLFITNYTQYKIVSQAGTSVYILHNYVYDDDYWNFPKTYFYLTVITQIVCSNCR